MGQRRSVTGWSLPEGVKADSLEARIARNLWRMMEKRGESDIGLGQKAKTGQAAVTRILTCKGYPRCDTLAKIAAKLELDVWQLLAPELDPEHPPMLVTNPEDRAYLEGFRAGQEMEARDESRVPRGGSPDPTTSPTMSGRGKKDGRAASK